MTTIVYDLNQLTDAQRRRAEALILVRGLFQNTIPGRTQTEIAYWIVTGSYS